MGIDGRTAFKNIISYLVESYNVTIENVNKFSISYENDEDRFQLFKEWRKHGEIIAGENISYEIKYNFLSFQENNYLVLENYNSNFNINFLEEVELNLGMFIFLFKDKRFYPKLNESITQDEVIDLLDIVDEEYKFHDFNTIKKLFSIIRVFKISEDCPFYFDKENIENSINRVLSLIFVYGHRQRKFSYLQNTTLDAYEKVIMTEINYFPYESILASLIDNKPTKVFLEIYRIIEKLYPYVMINELKEKLQQENENFKLDVFLLQESLNIIQWKHKEEDAIVKLFSKNYVRKTDEIVSLINETSENDLKLGTWVYRIRNSIVHLSLKRNTKDIDVKKVLKTDEILEWIIPILPDMYLDCFD